MLNKPETNNNDKIEINEPNLGEKSLKYLNIIGSIELLLGIFVAIIVFSQTSNVSDQLENSEQIKSLYGISALTIFISAIIIYIFIIAIYHILENSIENRKLLLKLTKNNDKIEKSSDE